MNLTNEERRILYALDPTKAKASSVGQYATRAEAVKMKMARIRLRDYAHLTLEEWQKIFDYQGGECFICGKKQTKKRLATDHRHATGQISGLLCSMCNRMLGWIEKALQPDPVLGLWRVIAYLKNPPATAALGEIRYGLPGAWSTKKAKKLVAKLKKAASLTTN